MRRPAFLAAVLMLAAASAAAQQGGFADSYYAGYFDDQLAENDWFFDRYGDPLADWPGSGDWYYRDELFSGLYDDGVAENDWFFDSYDTAADEGFFDV